MKFGVLLVSVLIIFIFSGCDGRIPNSNDFIIVDHRAVEDFEEIPDTYLDQVKTMLLNIPGASHGRAFVYGLELLEDQDSKFAVNPTWTGEPEGPTDTHLRIVRTYRNLNNTGWWDSCGEERFWTNQEGIDLMLDHLKLMRDAGNPVDAVSYAWSYEIADGDLAGGWSGRIYIDADRSTNGPSLSPWNLSSTSVSMDNYLNAVEHYLDAGERAFFATAPTDGPAASGEKGYQRYLKNQYIRDYVAARGSGILFDYDDIVAYNDAGDYNSVTWEGHTFSSIHPDNLGAGDYDAGQGTCHIDRVGALRLGKGLWYMMARIAGWAGTY